MRRRHAANAASLPRRWAAVGHCQPCPASPGDQRRRRGFPLLGRALRQLGIPGSQDDIGFHLGPQFLSERPANIYFGQHTKTLGFECLLHAWDRFLIRHVQGRAKTIVRRHRSFFLWLWSLSSSTTIHFRTRATTLRVNASATYRRAVRLLVCLTAPRGRNQ
jgi:hypothetical protein